ncbi:hypothetical protein N0V90_010193 [Kalmusia sp. IMI 367209]|nr:hypothetical protein N0V90_010193 [Kalmusia sp. IMI 367209]
MRQWGSSLNHNGMSFFMATVPTGTQLYHGTANQGGDRLEEGGLGMETKMKANSRHTTLAMKAKTLMNAILHTMAHTILGRGRATHICHHLHPHVMTDLQYLDILMDQWITIFFNLQGIHTDRQSMICHPLQVHPIDRLPTMMGLLHHLRHTTRALRHLLNPNVAPNARFQTLCYQVDLAEMATSTPTSPPAL